MDLLTKVQKEIGDRLYELNPLVEEYAALQAAESALATVSVSSTPRKRARATAKSKATSKSKGGRPAGSGKRREEVLGLISKHKNGLTAAEIGKKLGARPNYFYRILKTMEKEKLIVAQGKKWVKA